MAGTDKEVSFLTVTLERDRVCMGERVVVSFQRTLRIPDDGRAYPLPPGLGRFPIRSCADYRNRLPDAWRGDFFVPMHRREALWIGFDGTWWKPSAVKVGIGGVNAVSGDRWDEDLCADPQNYLVVPDQPWLDGINSGDGSVRQFVAVPMGAGLTVEAQLTDEERVGGVQLLVFEPKPGRFPDEAPSSRNTSSIAAVPQVMGIGVGGTIRQKIYPDSYGIDTWNPFRRGSFRLHHISAADFRVITRENMPSTPVDAAAYTAAGLPWFELYDENAGDIAPAKPLARTKSIRELERLGKEETVGLSEAQIRRLRKNNRDNSGDES